MKKVAGDRLYLGIVEQMMERIIMGDFKPGDRIPSVRETAVSGGVTPNTAAHAHTFLRDMGIIRPERGKGSVVEENGLELCRDFIMKRFKNAELPVLKRRLELLGLSREDLMRMLEGS